jgi:5-methylcytosine-specific restriction endonuclease McrA
VSVRLRSDGSLIGDKSVFIAERDGGWCCHYCGQALANWSAGQRPGCFRNWQGHQHTNGLCFPELDHVVPRAHGGSNKVANLVLACDPCNRTKRDRTYLEFVTGWREAT